MYYQQLDRLRLQLCGGQIKVSDALLLLMRLLRPRFPEERLSWLNRELLGYSKADLEAFYEKPKFGTLSVLFQPPKRNRFKLAIPSYRFLVGSWGSVDNEGRFNQAFRPTLEDKRIFCNIGIQEIEVQLDELEQPTASLFSMSYDESTGSEFFCSSKELLRIYDSVKQKLLDFIETVIDELEFASNER
jgi:hypothetical protein